MNRATRTRGMRVLASAAVAALLAASFSALGVAAAATAALPDASALDASLTLPAALCTPDQQRASERWWRFGNAAGLDFGVAGTTAVPFAALGNSEEGTTVVTDTTGELLFWSNGATIVNRNNVPMVNGTGLLGNPSATQTVAAFPLMFQPGKYVVATTGTNVGSATNNRLTYSVVDMALDAGRGAVVDGQKNLALGAANTASEALTAIPNADGSGFWVLTYTNNSPNILAYQFDGNGYTGTVITSVLPSNNYDWYGTLSLSPDRTMLLASTNQRSGASKLRLLSFDAATGAIAQNSEWAGSTSSGRYGYSADFSPSGDYVYFSRIFDRGQLYRYTIDGASTAEQIKASEFLVGAIGTNGGQVKRAPDGRMYVASYQTNKLSVVNNPDAAATADLDFVPHGLTLAAGSSSSFGLPQMVTGCLSLDFGDAPDSYGTLLGSSGPVHSYKTGLSLGTEWDAESDGQPSPDTDGDDLNGTINDEDGVADPIAIRSGHPTVVTVTATNPTGSVATLAGWIDLNGNGTFDADELQQLEVPANASEASFTLNWPAQAVVPTESYARFRIFSGVVAAPSPLGSAVGGEVEDYRVYEPSFAVAKTASALSARPGETVDYTVTVTNTGVIPFTTASPADFTDDLSGVLDDASYVAGSATEGATVSGNTLSWSGPLAVEESKTISYSVTVQNMGGDGALDNIVAPGTNGSCDPAASCSTSTAVQSFSVLKSTTAMAVVAGETVPYSITVTNTGQLDYTSADPASFSDDLSAVLDDATYNNDADNGATYSAPNLGWSGPLAVGDSVTISYSATVNTPVSGDSKLANTVVTPAGSGGDCPSGSDNLNCVVHVPGQSYTVDKTVSATSAIAGDEVSYTVTVENTGAVAYTADAPATFSDDLSGVLDDATYNGDASDGAAVAGGMLSWAGELAVGETKTITYSVTVNSPAGGDKSLENSVTATNRGGSCDPDGACTTSTPLASFTVSKLASSTTVMPGGTVAYTVTVTNTGPVGYTAAAPASFTDDLSKVLDDASYNDDATNGATVVDGLLAWSGELPIGATTVVSYSVTVNSPATGDRMLANTVVPDAATGGACAADACETLTPVSSYVVVKTVSQENAKAGDTVDYTITVTNTGAVDFTEGYPATFVDDLSEVLDDAAYNGDASAGTSYLAPSLSWTGALPVGESVAVTYSVTLKTSAGDGTLRNVVFAPASSGADCLPGGNNPVCETETVFDPAPLTPVTPVTPVEPSSPLASTGVQVGVFGGLAALLLASGGGMLLLLLTRRRSRQNG